VVVVLCLRLAILDLEFGVVHETLDGACVRDSYPSLDRFVHVGKRPVR